MATERGRPRARGAAVAVAAVVLGLLGACGGDEPAERAPAAPPSARPDLPGEVLLGDWWVLSEDRPYLALRVSLARAEDGAIAGTWRRFDRLGSDGEVLTALSEAVPCRARPHEDTWVIEGALPEVDADGRATGLSGPLIVWCAEPAEDGWRGHLIEEHDDVGAGAGATIGRAWRDLDD